jgi:exosortase
MAITGHVQQRKVQVAWVGAIVLLLSAMYWKVGGLFLQRAVTEPAFYHCLIVPALAAWLLWRRRDTLIQAIGQPSWAGVALLIWGLLMYVVAQRLGVHMIVGFSLPFIIVGIIGATYGLRLVLAAWLPLVLLFFAIPLPEHVVGMIAMPLQQVSATLAVKLASLLGLGVVQSGVTLTLNGFDFVVAEECSGMRSLIALLLTSVVLVELFDLQGLRKTAAIALIPPIVLMANVVRLVFVLLTGHYFGGGFAVGTVVHNLSDIVVYAAALLTWFLVLGWLQERQFAFHAAAGDQASV